MLNLFGFLAIGIVLFFMTEMFMRGIKQMRTQEKTENKDA